jgi:SAM-dependent methyltransferase
MRVMKTPSLWDQTLTFFPQFLQTLGDHVAAAKMVAVIGASDGKFVLPLAKAGYRVIAIERDSIALHGGEIQLPDGSLAHSLGLVGRLKAEGLADQVDVIEGDFLTTDSSAMARCDAVWTSCSWHYSANHQRPLGLFLDRMQSLLAPGGMFGAEFMMPITPRQRRIEHYTSPERLLHHFPPPWQVLLTLRTGIFTEGPHIGQPDDHDHRMGMLLARRILDLDGNGKSET